MVTGHMLVSLGMVAGRTIYRFTSPADVYLLVPDLRETYLLQRPADGYAGVFDTMEEAVASIDTLEEGEAIAAHPTRIPGHVTQ